MNMSDNSRFIYMPASALASRRIIEQSSYSTTPNQSSTDATPPCGEAVYKRSLDDDKINNVDLFLEMEQISDSELLEPHSRKEFILGGNEDNTSNRVVDRVFLKKGKRTNEDKPGVSKISSMFDSQKKSN